LSRKLDALDESIVHFSAESLVVGSVFALGADVESINMPIWLGLPRGFRGRVTRFDGDGDFYADLPAVALAGAATGAVLFSRYDIPKLLVLNTTGGS
jgi:hypothetical protein